jgi:outer membrane autotransporter protein
MTHAFAFGSDYRWNNWFMTGLSFAYTRSDVDTTFNRGTLKSNGYNFAPYAVVSLIPNKLFLDVSAGYGFGDSKSTRTNGAITGSTDKSNYFVSGGLNMVLTANRWFAQPSAGILWSRSQWDAYRESNGTAVPRVVNHFGRMHVGSDVGYAFNSWQPFVGAKYLYDYKFEHAKDRNGVLIATAHRNAAELSMGTSVSLTNRLSGTLKGSTEAFRKDNSTYSFSGSLRYAF